MKGWIMENGNLIFAKNLRKPKIKKGWALVEVESASLCGSDLKIIDGKMDVCENGIVLGHEFAGKIAKIAPPAANFKIGDRVAVNPYIPCKKCWACKISRFNLCKNMKIIGAHFHGGFGKYSLAPIENLILIGDLDFKCASLIQPVACALSAVDKIDINTCTVKLEHDDGIIKETFLGVTSSLNGSKILILGGGPMGLLIGYIAKERGAKIFIAERNWKRRSHYCRLITDESFNPNSPGIVYAFEKEIMEKTGGGADIIVDAVGSLLRNAYKYVKEGGMILLFGLNKDAELNQYKLTKQEINKMWPLRGLYLKDGKFIRTRKKARIIGSYLALPKFFNDAYEWITLPEHKKFLDDLTSHNLRLESLETGIKLLKNGEAMKIIVCP